MKRLILISCLLINLSFCVQAKRSPFDPNSPSSFLTSLIVLTTTVSGSSSSSSGIPSLSYSTQTYSFYVGETVSISANTSNVKSCSISPVLPTGLNLNTTTCSISGTAGATSSSKSYTIIATGNGVSISANLTLSVGPIYRTYIISSTVTGNVTTATADTTCNSNGLKPNSGTYKAVLVSSTRRACSTSYCSSGVSENLDWVFKALSSYFRSDGITLIGKTNTSGIFSNENNFTTFSNSFSSSSFNYWTGMNFDFTNNSNNCLNWTSNSGANNGIIGYSLSNDTALSSNSFACNTSNYLLCVEQ
jgi:hypothetical protein